MKSPSDFFTPRSRPSGFWHELSQRGGFQSLRQNVDGNFFEVDGVRALNVTWSGSICMTRGHMGAAHFVGYDTLLAPATRANGAGHGARLMMRCWAPFPGRREP